MIKEARAISANKGTAVPVIIDCFSILLAIVIWPNLMEQFHVNSGLNAAVIGLFFILFCVAVFWLKKLETDQATSAIPLKWLSENKLRAFGFLFGIALAAGLAHQLGYFDLILEVDDRVLGAGESSAFFVYAPGAWLGAGLIYTLVISSTSAPRYKIGHSDYWSRTGLGILGVNLMLIIGTAELTAVCQSTPIYIAFFIISTLLLLLFLPPRLIYLMKQNSISSLISFTIFMLVLINLSIRYIA